MHYACARSSPDQIEALDGVIRAYAQSVGPELSRYEEQVKAACDSLRTQPANAYFVASDRRGGPRAGMFWVLR